MEKKQLAALLSLPAELINSILRYLSADDLASLSRTCHLLHEYTLDEVTWARLLQEHVPSTNFHSPHPAPSYRKLFLLYHPYWFIPKYKIWFSDTIHHGRLLIARYSHKRQTIEAYALAAERRTPSMLVWEWNPDVLMHTFDPRIQLDLNQPCIKLNLSSSEVFGDLKTRLAGEIPMDFQSDSPRGGLRSRLRLARTLNEKSIGPRTQVWPPQTLPALGRVHNTSRDGFNSSGHKPSSTTEMSEHAFRIRRWTDFGHSLAAQLNLRVGEEISTFATLPPEAYTPTELKPWRGIWCGDYSGHGCEFLVVLQPDDPVALPQEALDRLQPSGPRRNSSTLSFVNWVSSALAMTPTPVQYAEGEEFDWPPQEQISHLNDEEEAIYNGQLLAVKLTGDPNIPRGEYTFIAPDIGKEGLLRIANEDIFKGARVVKSLGHVASENFRDDYYIPAQLILISHDTIGVYWQTLGHLSFFKRVDIDQFTVVD